jgi:hypothetical protein
LKEFPTSPLWPEASLLAGYVELADCKFDDSQKWYDELTKKLQPIVDEIDRVRKDPELRKQLFAKAVTRFREVKETGEIVGKKLKDAPDQPRAPIDDVLALLRLDPKFLRLNDAVNGMNALAANAGSATRQWQNLGAQVSERHVGAISKDKTPEQEQLVDANALVEDLRRLEGDIAKQKSELAQARREGTLAPDAADAEAKRLDELAHKTATAEASAVTAADTAAKAVSASASGGIKPLIEADIGDARRLDHASHDLAIKLTAAGEQLAEASIDKLYADTRRVLDKAKLGKVDAVIGQKRKLDIQVQDLAAGRFPEELIGRLWNASLIGDDEEFWPFQGEYWADEYEGFR